VERVYNIDKRRSVVSDIVLKEPSVQDMMCYLPAKMIRITSFGPGDNWDVDKFRRTYGDVIGLFFEDVIHDNCRTRCSRSSPPWHHGIFVVQFEEYAYIADTLIAVQYDVLYEVE